jgi:hypothetical protein
MRIFFVVIFAALSLVACSTHADECEGSWHNDAAKSGDIDTLRNAKLKAGLCVIRYASEAAATLSLKIEIEKELKKDPENAALKRLKEIAAKEAISKGSRALAFTQIQRTLNQLINTEIAKRLEEQLKSSDVAI